MQMYLATIAEITINMVRKLMMSWEKIPKEYIIKNIVNRGRNVTVVVYIAKNALKTCNK